jgi:hypothetical protein
VRPLALVPLLLLAACGGERRGARLPGGCTPNQTVACLCAPGVEGIQVCQPDHTFEPCQCLGGEADAGTTERHDAGIAVMDAGSWDGGQAERDAGAEDARPARDAEPPFDAGLPEDAGDPIDAGFFDSGVHPDAMVFDSGMPVDAGFPDAGFPDTGVRPDAGFPDSGVHPDAGTPACTQDSQCASGRCHPLYNQCVPTGRKLHCETCTSDAECGLGADHCLAVTIGGLPAETICGQGCNAHTDCPQGYECSLNNHCYPIPGSIRPHTCASLRDTLAVKACDPLLSTDQCGLPTFDDGTCVLGIGCSVGCVSHTDCPSGTLCTSWFVGDFCLLP